MQVLFLKRKDALQAINAAYQPLMFNNANKNFYWAFGVLASDRAVVGGDGSRPVDRNRLYDAYSAYRRIERLLEAPIQRYQSM
jgi:hypothetical protein